MSGSLLVPLDGSALGEAVLPWASAFARARNLSLLLTRAVPWPIIPGNGLTTGYMSYELYEQILAAERQAATDYLETVRQGLASESLATELVVREGDVAEALLDLADERGAEAIAMTTHGRGGLTRLVLGSVAERVLQQATTPVLLVRVGMAKAAPGPGFERLLVPLDGSLLAARALDTAREIGEGAHLILLRVVEPVRQVLSSMTTTTVVDEEATWRAITRAEEYLAGAKRELDQAGRSSEARVRRGSAGAGEEILAEARERGAGLIVMATHGHTGASRWLLGSVADHVIRRSEIPVLLVSARALAAQVVGRFTVQDVMTRDLATVRDDEPLSVALRKLLRRRVSGVPVVNASGDLVGVVSEHDLLEWHARLEVTLAKHAIPVPAEYARRLDRETVRQIMSQPPVTIEPSAPLDAAIHLFREKKLRRLPVTHEGHLVGILTRADALKAMATQWQSASPDQPD